MHEKVHHPVSLRRSASAGAHPRDLTLIVLRLLNDVIAVYLILYGILGLVRWQAL